MPKEYVCHNCGKTYTPKSPERNKYCSRDCYFKSGKIGCWYLKKENKTKHCIICGKQVPNRNKYCSIACVKMAEGRRAYKRNSARKELKAHKCKECGLSFVPKYGDKKRSFCSSACSYKHSRRIRRQIERARLRLVKVESVDAVKVMMRDKWICQICGIKLRRQDRGTTKDKAPELDHIIPLSKGGEHSYCNTQCACRKCNIKKGAVERGQLRLFG